MAVEPDERQLEEVRATAGSGEDRPVVMLNLHRYRDRASYARYAAVAFEVLAGLERAALIRFDGGAEPVLDAGPT